MPSFIPEHTYGLIPGSYRDHGGPRYGLIPWPAHLRPRGEPASVEVTKKGGAYCTAKASLPDIDLFELFGEEPKTVSELPALAEARGVFFLTLTKDRTSIATTIERLINMLDDMDGDENLEATGDEDRELDEADSEPWLGAPELHPASFEAVFCGVLQPRSGFLRHDCSKSQAAWAAGGSDDREDEDEREDGNDAEFSYGWANEGSQTTLRSDDEQEPELGWTEHVDQAVAGVQADACWMVPDGEPLLGWCENAGMGVRKGEPADDREGDDEREDDPAELGIADDDAMADPGLTFAAGGRGPQYLGDGHREARNLLRKANGQPPLVEKAKKLPDDTIVRRLDPRSVDVMMIPELRAEDFGRLPWA